MAVVVVPAPKSQVAHTVATADMPKDVGEKRSFPIAEGSALARCGKQHLPRSKQRRTIPKYTMFQAASHGCLACVRCFLEGDESIDPLSVSDNNKYTVLDFAKYAVETNTPGAIDVVRYLAERWPELVPVDNAPPKCAQ